jgi:hypothetical protein
VYDVCSTCVAQNTLGVVVVVGCIRGYNLEYDIIASFLYRMIVKVSLTKSCAAQKDFSTSKQTNGQKDFGEIFRTKIEDRRDYTLPVVHKVVVFAFLCLPAFLR